MDDLMMNIHQTRPNMLDVVMENFNASAMRGPSISRMLYAGKLNARETSKQRVADWHEQMMKAAGTLNRMTGFLLVYPTCVLHFLEAESASLTKILLALQANAKSEAPVLEGVCVLSYTEDVHSSGPTQHTGFIQSISQKLPFLIHEQTNYATEVETPLHLRSGGLLLNIINSWCRLHYEPFHSG
ncbi:unnamed protein product [Sphagnum jensenii]|uniref:Uncharacterized protein n=1 Tax=Sphagnum jensenii TaxID=128206 RepID=A0ABP1BLM7_9BRYO